MIFGKILRSDGEYADMQIGAKDSTGKSWFTKDYSIQTGLRSYSESRDRSQDPIRKYLMTLQMILEFMLPVFMAHKTEEFKKHQSYFLR